MQFIIGLGLAIEILLVLYFFYSTLYNLILSVASLKRLKYNIKPAGKFHDITVFIPAYKEDGIIENTIKNILESDYPKEKFKIYLIADSLEESTLDQMKKYPIEIVEVEFENSTKVKSLNAAFNYAKRNFDICLVLDADNFLSKGFLRIVNFYYAAGYLSVQGMRVPKNKNTDIAILDGLSEAINNNIVRKGTCILGGSSAIVGSGFAVRFDLLREVLSDMESVSGFDKELEIKLLQKGVKTIYAEDLVVFDEKVSNSNDFKSQRKRWMYSQYFYLRKYFKASIAALFAGKITLFNSAFLRYAQLPRFVNIVLLFLLTILFTLIHHHNSFIYVIWWGLFVCTLLSILLAIPKHFYSASLLKALWQLPKTFFIMFGLLFKLKGTNKKYIHTPHGKTD